MRYLRTHGAYPCRCTTSLQQSRSTKGWLPPNFQTLRPEPLFVRPITRRPLGTVHSGGPARTDQLSAKPTQQCSPEPSNDRTQGLRFYAVCLRSTVFLHIYHRNVSGLVYSVSGLSARNLLLGHSTGPNDAIAA